MMGLWGGGSVGKGVGSPPSGGWGDDAGWACGTTCCDRLVELWGGGHNVDQCLVIAGFATGTGGGLKSVKGPSKVHQILLVGDEGVSDRAVNDGIW